MHGVEGMKSSLHGGHSGQFCDHAQDSLAELVEAYHRQGFELVGISEHMPPLGEPWLYPDEVALGRTAAELHERFGQYVVEGRRLAGVFAGRMRVLVGMESEWYDGCAEWIPALRAAHALDYVVGSVHHLQGICFDYSRGAYEGVVEACGGLARMYAEYFDAQLEMMQATRPEVVGHFDLIRLHDADYERTLAEPEVWKRVVRNLEWVRANGLILDINARALLKGQAEPYVCRSVRKVALALGIPCVYGDDAHGTCDVGFGFESVTTLLAGHNHETSGLTAISNPEMPGVSRPST